MYKTCNICCQQVGPRNGLQHAKCGTWTHYGCLKYTDQILEVDSGIINAAFPCPDCFKSPEKSSLGANKSPDKSRADALSNKKVFHSAKADIQSNVVNHFQYANTKRQCCSKEKPQQNPCQCDQKSNSTQTRDRNSNKGKSSPPRRIIGSMRIDDNVEQNNQGCQCPCSEHEDEGPDECQHCKTAATKIQRQNYEAVNAFHRKCCKEDDVASESNDSSSCPKKVNLEEMCNKVCEMSKEVDDIMVKLLKIVRKPNEVKNKQEEMLKNKKIKKGSSGSFA